MFSGTGFQIHGGTFYNVGGDVNLQTHHHLTIQDHHAAFHPVALADSALGIVDGQAGGSDQHSPVQDEELRAAGFQLQAPTDTTSIPENSECEGEGVVRSLRHDMTTRPAPYGAPKIRE
jgi:hypothetical protein